MKKKSDSPVMAAGKYGHKADETCNMRYQNERKEIKETTDTLKEPYKSEIEETVK